MPSPHQTTSANQVKHLLQNPFVLLLLWTLPLVLLAYIALTSDFENERARFILDAAMLVLALGVVFLAVWIVSDKRNRNEALKRHFQVAAEMESQLDDLEREEYRFNSVFNAVNIGMVIVNRHGFITHVNNTLCRLFGYEADELVGEKIEVLVPDAVKARHPDYRDAAFDDDTGRYMGMYDDGRLLGQRKDGSTFKTRILLSSFKMDSAPFVVASVEDITEVLAQQEEIRVLQKRRLEEAEEAKTQALEVAKSKSDFLANMSHEIRTPLNAVIGMSSLLADSHTLSAPEDIERVRKINFSGRSLLRIINDILDFSKIDAGKMTLERSTYTLGQVVDQLHALFLTTAEQKGLTFEIEHQVDLNLVLVGDRIRLEQVLINLISNALKFTTEGGIVLKVELHDVTDDSCKLTFSVIDSGIGMTEEQCDTIFQAFSQADSTITRRFGGTGLGLSISGKLVELMGGHLWANSAPGEGSTFTFTLPVEVDHDQVLIDDGNTQVDLDLSQFKILVVDDNDFNLDVAEQFLSKWGAGVQTFDNAREAIDWLQSDPSGIDAILMDLQMPDVDGYEATRTIRNLGFSEIPILACSAGVSEDQRTEAEEAGMNGFLAKPFTKDQLNSALAGLLPDTPRKAKVAEPAPAVTTELTPERTAEKAPEPINEEADLPLIDIENGETNWGGEADFKRFVAKFLSRYGDLAEQMETLYEAGDLEELRKLAHKMRGASASVFLKALAASLTDIELKLKQGEPVSAQEMTALKAVINETLEAIQSHTA